MVTSRELFHLLAAKLGLLGDLLLQNLLFPISLGVVNSGRSINFDFYLIWVPYLMIRLGVKLTVISLLIDRLIFVFK